MRMAIFTALIWASPVCADWRGVAEQADRAFARLPDVVEVARIAGRCGADASVNPGAVYCTSENRIYLARGAGQADYLVAHLMGHAVQVRHGIADRALSAIVKDRSREAAIRAVVVAQVECLAGFFVRRAGVKPGNWFATEPFTGAHWGRNPLRRGPRVSVGAAARAQSFRLGYGGDIAQCDALGGDLASGLLNRAYRGR